MNVNGGKGLWHERKMATQMTFANPKGIESISPGLRGTSYPGKTSEEVRIPNGIVANVTRYGENELAATALRLGCLADGDP